MSVQITVDEVLGLQESAKFLEDTSQALYDSFDDPEFKRAYYTAVERVKQVAEKLGRVGITVNA